MPEPTTNADGTPITPPATPPTPATPSNVTLTVDGYEKTMTLEEVKALATKAAGADRKFQEAAEIRKGAQRGIRVLEIMDDLKAHPDKNDPNLTAELFAILGLDMTNPQPEQEPEPQSRQRVTPPTAITMDNLGPREKYVMEKAEEAALRETRRNIEEETRNVLDKDPVLGKMIEELPEAARQPLKDELFEMAKEGVRTRILAGEFYGPDMRIDVVQRLRNRMQKLGIPAKLAGQPMITGAGSMMNFGPEIHANEPIKRVPINDPGYNENAVKRVQQMIVKAARSMAGRGE